MESRIAKEIKLNTYPVVTIFTDEKPEGALQFKEGRRGCVVAMFSACARGKTAVFDRETIGCAGGRVGLCFGSVYDQIPGGIEYFLSSGRGEGYPEGEGYKKTPELAKDLVENFPIMDIPNTYVVFKPLKDMDPGRDNPQLVTFLATPDQLSALVVLANYGRTGNENAIIPFAAACSTIVLIPYNESKKERPRAVVGMVDISGRPHVEPDMLSFTVPWEMYQQMEADVPGSFFEREAWKKLVTRIPEPLID